MGGTSEGRGGRLGLTDGRTSHRSDFKFADTLDRVDLSGLRVSVVGGGVLGLSVAALASLAGAHVRLHDPSPSAWNASRVAAGMLSPALEALLEEREGAYPLLQAAYEAWPAFLSRLDLPEPAHLDAGALYVGSDDELAGLASGLQRIGASFEAVTASELERLQPGLMASSRNGLRLRKEGRIDPPSLMPALTARLRAAGVEFLAIACSPRTVVDADAVVIACGYDARAWSALAPELAVLSPIKGQVLHFGAGPRGGPVVRTAQGYAAPHDRGVVFGATMEPGRDDLEVDAAAVADLHASAVELFPELAEAPYAVRVGVRATVADGMPLVGRSAAGPVLATAARRNGWLLAPLIAAAAVEALAGAPARPQFDPLRLWTDGEIVS